MSTTCASKISWIRSPTRSYIACISKPLGETSLDVVHQRELGAALSSLAQQAGAFERGRDVLSDDTSGSPGPIGSAACPACTSARR